jgi:hypothetical protein
MPQPDDFWTLGAVCTTKLLTAPRCNDLLTLRYRNKLKIRSILALGFLNMQLINSAELYEARRIHGTFLRPLIGYNQETAE